MKNSTDRTTYSAAVIRPVLLPLLGFVLPPLLEIEMEMDKNDNLRWESMWKHRNLKMQFEIEIWK